MSFRFWIIGLFGISLTANLYAAPDCGLRVDNLFSAHELQQRIERKNAEDVVFYDAAINALVPELQPNRYYAAEFDKMSFMTRKKIALSFVRSYLEQGRLPSDRLPPGFRSAVEAELAKISDSVSIEGGQFAELQRSHFADHIQFLLDNLRDPSQSQLRRDLVGVLGLVSGETRDYAASMRVLAALGRGYGTMHFTEPKIANDAIKTLQYRAGKDPFRLPTGMRLENHSHAVRLLMEPITSVEVFNPSGTHGNVNGVFIVTFGSGLRAVFKPADGEKNYGIKHANWIHYKNEANAFHVYELIRSKLPPEMANDPGVFVPASIEAVVTHNGKNYGIGSLQVFVEGYETLKTIQERDWGYFERLNSHPDMAVARLIKVILGDYDSFPHRGSVNGNMGNIMARHFGSKLKIALIDNGVGRVDGLEGSYYQVNECPVKEHIAPAWRQAVKQIDTDALRQLYLQRRLLNPGGLENMLGRIKQFQQQY